METVTVGAPVAVKLSGQPYVLSPLGVGDMVLLEEEAERQIWQAAAEQVAHLEALGAAAPEARKAVADKAAAAAEDGSAFAAYVRSQRGRAHAAWLSLRRQHPQMTLDDVLLKMTVHEAPDVEAKLDAISFPSRRPAVEGASPNADRGEGPGAGSAGSSAASLESGPPTSGT